MLTALIRSVFGQLISSAGTTDRITTAVCVARASSAPMRIVVHFFFAFLQLGLLTRTGIVAGGGQAPVKCPFLPPTLEPLLLLLRWWAAWTLQDGEMGRA